jgi:hypothetical protein
MNFTPVAGCFGCDGEYSKESLNSMNLKGFWLIYAGESGLKHSFIKVGSTSSKGRFAVIQSENSADPARRGNQVKAMLNWMGKFAIVLLAGVIGGMVGRYYPSAVRVHAQETSTGNMSCKLTIPKSWGEYKGASAFGLAFQDPNGTLRFLQHPACGNMSSYSDYGPVDLELMRR